MLRFPYLFMYSFSYFVHFPEGFDLNRAICSFLAFYLTAEREVLLDLTCLSTKASQCEL